MTDDIENEIYKAFFDFVKLCNPDEQIYPLNSNHIAPDGVYTTIEVSSIDPIASGPTSMSGPDTNACEFEICTQFQGFVVIDSYGKGAMSRLQSIVVGLRDPYVRKLLSDKGFGYSSHSKVQNTSVAVTMEKIEKRASVSVSFYFTQGGLTRGEDPGFIDTVTVDGEINN